MTGRIRVDAARCDGCEGCTRSCPSGALRIALQGDETGLVWEIGRCIQCRLCERVCPQEAIAFIEDENGFGERTNGELVLHLDVRACVRCGAPFGMRNTSLADGAGEEGELDERLVLCPRCRRRASVVCRPIWKEGEPL